MSAPHGVLCVFGTRPEAIKMAPVVLALEQHPGFDPVVAVTAQHRHMLDQVLDAFGITADHDLDIGQDRQTLVQITTRTLDRLAPVLAQRQPDLVVVQGDTTTAFASALAAFYQRVPVAHVEAGLRSGDPTSPYPEELNRRLITQLASLHLAPTPAAAAQLGAEGVPARQVVCTGNTVIDALAMAGRWSGGSEQPWLAELETDPRRVVLVTVHRRESWGAPLAGIARALARVAGSHPEVVVVLPVHKNPVVREVMVPVLERCENVRLVEPLGYGDFARLLRRSYLVVTDSGGIQEEAPSLGKPVLVLRDVTERPEAVEAGTVELIGTDEGHVQARIQTLLCDAATHERMARAISPYGDGRAAERTLVAIEWFLGDGDRPLEFAPPSTAGAPDADPAPTRRPRRRTGRASSAGDGRLSSARFPTWSA